MSEPNPYMEFENGLPLDEKNGLFVYHILQDHKTKTFQICFELRDYNQHYLRIVKVPEQFMDAIITKMNLAHSLGYAYQDPQGATFKDGIK